MLRLLLSLAALASAQPSAPPLFDFGSSALVQLDDTNFDKLVVRDDSALWVVKFYADWCGHCMPCAGHRTGALSHRLGHARRRPLPPPSQAKSLRRGTSARRPTWPVWSSLAPSTSRRPRRRRRSHRLGRTARLPWATLPRRAPSTRCTAESVHRARRRRPASTATPRSSSTCRAAAPRTRTPASTSSQPSTTTSRAPPRPSSSSRRRRCRRTWCRWTTGAHRHRNRREPRQPP